MHLTFSNKALYSYFFFDFVYNFLLSRLQVEVIIMSLHPFSILWSTFSPYFIKTYQHACDAAAQADMGTQMAVTSKSAAAKLTIR